MLPNGIVANTSTVIGHEDGVVRWFGGLPSNTKLGRRSKWRARQISCRLGWVTGGRSSVVFARGGRTVSIVDQGDAVFFVGQGVYAADIIAAVKWFMANGSAHIDAA